MRKAIVLFEIIRYLGLLMTSSESYLQNNINIIRPPKDYFPKGGSLELACEAEGSPMPVITWYDARTMTPAKEDREIDLKVYKDLLIIKNPGEREIYEFFCNASNGIYWKKSRNVRTGLAFLSSDFKQEPPSLQVVKQLQTIILSCRSPSGVPFPKVHWLKDGKIISPKIFLKEKRRLFLSNNHGEGMENVKWSLNIRSAEILDSGRYQCVATNDYGRVESSGSWVVVSANLETSFNVKIEIMPKDLNQDVAFICNTEEGENIRWISLRSLYFNKRINISSNLLLIRRINWSDKGFYACESNGSSPRLLKIYQLNIGSQELIDERSRVRKKVVIEGVNVVLECDFENTQTEFYWETPNSQPIFPNDFSHGRIHVTSNGNLNINNVQSTDSGKYTCNAHSSLDTAHRSIWLDVSKNLFDMYPIISVPCQNLTVLRGSDINLRCEVIGEDIIKINWYTGLRIRKIMLGNSKISFPSKYSLRIINSGVKEDSNFYTCEAINEQGNQASWTSLVEVVDNYDLSTNFNPVRDLPLPPVVEPPKNIKATSVELTWSHISNHYSDILYWIEYVTFGSSMGWSIYRRDWKDSSITIDNLTPDTWYQFLVRSKTYAGIGRASVPTEYVKTIRKNKSLKKIEFSFSKIKLHIPMIRDDRETMITWSLNQITNGDKPQAQEEFYIVYRAVSMLQCIVSMSNGQDFDLNHKTSSLSNYCSLAEVTSEKLKAIKENESLSTDISTKLMVDLNRANITISRDVSEKSHTTISCVVPSFPAFHCFNLSILSGPSPHKSIRSNSRLILTPEARPSRPPEQIHISWVLPEISININWNIPHRKYWNGILTGSNIYMKSNVSEIVLKYNDTTPHKIIKRVNSEVDWIFRISINNCIGESQKSAFVTLRRLTSSFGVQTFGDSIFKRSWMIATLVITSLLIWIMLCTLTAYLCCLRSSNAHHLKNSNSTNCQDHEVGRNVLTKDSFMDINHDMGETEKMLQNSNEDKFSSNNCVSSGPSSSPSNVSYCNPYASTKLFEGATDHKPPDFNLFYLSSPIFEPLPATKPASAPLNFYLPNVQDRLGNQILSSSFHHSPKVFPFNFPEQYRRNSNGSDISRTTKDKINNQDPKAEDKTINNSNGTLNNLLISTAPFSDHFSTSSKSKSVSMSSNSDSTHPIGQADSSKRFALPNLPSKSGRRRQDHTDPGDQSTEMTHLLVDHNGRNSPSVAQVYDTPYSESVIDCRANGQ